MVSKGSAVVEISSEEDLDVASAVGDPRVEEVADDASVRDTPSVELYAFRDSTVVVDASVTDVEFGFTVGVEETRSNLDETFRAIVAIEDCVDFDI